MAKEIARREDPDDVETAYMDMMCEIDLLLNAFREQFGRLPYYAAELECFRQEGFEQYARIRREADGGVQ